MHLLCLSAVNAAGRSEYSSCTSPVKIQEVVGGEGPEFIRTLSNTSLPRGKQLVLECEATGKPLPKPRWLKNGREIQYNVRIRQEVDGGKYRLILTDLQDGDEGDYTCQASNPLGHTYTSARVRIGSPPKIDRAPTELFLPEGENTKIKIYFSGDQPMVIKLFKDGTELSDSSHLKVTIFDDYLVIYIKEIHKDDAGDYSLRISNDSGSVSASFTVHITGLPSAPQGPLEISDISKHMCTLAWKPPSYGQRQHCGSNA